ncbi:MAG: phosphonoacetaldehyde hydrolase [Tannerellaceae bacterium]|nr:phosphonoacetaldehyde hydrolase [Tannerellaceae bacterium]MCD8264478.1 phosphonoacetaldehyde hydrolase [Tannerellaceae bacterium]
MCEIKCVIMDWAGTAVDYGCFAPLNAFIKVFKEERGIDITTGQARAPMGLLKIDHIRAILQMPEVNASFENRYGRAWNEQDVQKMYLRFEKHLFDSLTDFTGPIPYVIDTLQQLRNNGIKIGSTTGYTQAMMDVVQPGAAAKGYTVDKLVTPDHLPAGRPAPYMIYQNMIGLAIPSVEQVVKVGDTIADIKEGVNAKVWSIGVILGSNEMGLTEAETNALSPEQLQIRMEEVRTRMYNAGAAYVLDSIRELPACIEQINQQLKNKQP